MHVAHIYVHICMCFDSLNYVFKCTISEFSLTSYRLTNGLSLENARKAASNAISELLQKKSFEEISVAECQAEPTCNAQDSGIFRCDCFQRCMQSFDMQTQLVI